MDVATVALDVKPNTSNSHGWKYYADEINKTWHKGAAVFIQCGQLLIDAKAELQSDAFNAMVKNKLAFDRSVGAKLMLIAANQTLCAHGHKLPPCWTTLYELSKLPDEILKAKFTDNTINPGMQRADALRLKPKKVGGSAEERDGEIDASSPTSSNLSFAWDGASEKGRREFLDKLGRDGLCAAMSTGLMADLRDHVINVTIAGASKTAPFAVYATNMLHSALRCAEQPKTEDHKHMAAALGRLIKQAAAKGISRSDIVIAVGKVRKSKT
jgi:hypothetical protein